MRHLPEVTTSGTSFPICLAMNPRIAKIGKPAKILVKQFPRETIRVSLQEIETVLRLSLWYNVYCSARDCRQEVQEVWTVSRVQTVDRGLKECSNFGKFL